MALSKETTTIATAMSTRRAQMDIKKLLASEHVIKIEPNLTHLYVKVCGPRHTCYEGGIWTVKVVLPTEYPYKAPLIRFSNKIFHPNVEYDSGIVCMNVLREAWSPIYDLLNIFDIFLPQLLRNPNPTDPLNHLAASLLTRTPRIYKERVVQFVRMYAAPQWAEVREYELFDRKSEPTVSMSALAASLSKLKTDNEDIQTTKCWDNKN